MRSVRRHRSRILFALLLTCALGLASVGSASAAKHRVARHHVVKRCQIKRVHGKRVCVARHAAVRRTHAAPVRHVVHTPASPTGSAPPPTAPAATATTGAKLSVPASTTSTPGGDAPTSSMVAASTLPPLKWAPPALSNPITVTLGTGVTHTTLSTSRDYLIKLPSTRKVGGTWIEGGHNVKIVGGSITIPSTSSATTAQRTALYIKDATGTVHVEGVLIDGSGGSQFDGIDIAAPKATVQLENLRVVGVNGGLNSWHADVVQPWGGVKGLRVDRFSGASNYQGLMLIRDQDAIGSAELSNVDMTATTDPEPDHGGQMLMLSNTTSCTTYPVSVSSFYIVPRPGRTVATSVWPSALASGCVGLTGVPQLGPPPSGSYVPPGVAGLGYSSPGYGAP